MKGWLFVIVLSKLSPYCTLWFFLLYYISNIPNGFMPWRYCTMRFWHHYIPMIYIYIHYSMSIDVRCSILLCATVLSFSAAGLWLMVSQLIKRWLWLEHWWGNDHTWATLKPVQWSKKKKTPCFGLLLNICFVTADISFPSISAALECIPLLFCVTHRMQHEHSFVQVMIILTILLSELIKQGTVCSDNYMPTIKNRQEHCFFCICSFIYVQYNDAISKYCFLAVSSLLPLH